MIAGKHYVSFEVDQETGLMLGVMRPGEAMQSASSSPLEPEFFLHFTRLERSVQYNNILSAAVCTAHLAGIATHTIGEYVTLIERHGMEWKVFLVLLKWECYLIWMRGHCCQYTTMEQSWV